MPPHAPESQASPPVLSVAGLEHSFGAKRVLHGIDLSLSAGEFCVLLGLNGAGKSTLFALVSRLYAIRSGSVSVLGHDLVSDAPGALRYLGVVFQSRTLDPDLTVMQNLLYHGALHGMSRAQTRQRAEEELSRAGLSALAGARVRALSGGQARRAEIARALIHRPRLLLLDEPTVGLDVAARQGLLSHVHDLCRTDLLAVLWATHLIDEVSPNATLAILHEGRLAARGSAGGLLAESGAPDVATLFADIAGTHAPASSGGRGHAAVS